MAIYSINDLEQLCGIKAHTLRVWEKRYGIIKPKRTKTNIRYFRDEDLQKILNIALLNKHGIKISIIAAMSEEEMKEAVTNLSSIGPTHVDKMDGLVIAMLELDDYKFNKILSHNIKGKGFEETMNVIIYPFMDKLSMMWMTGNIRRTHENFVAAQVRRKLILEIETTPFHFDKSMPKFLLYLPEGETQELSILYLHFLLKQMGIFVSYLGSNISTEDIVEAQKTTTADVVFALFNDGTSGYTLQSYADELSEQLEDSTLIISGYQTMVQNIEPKNNVKVLSSVEDVKSYAQQLLDSRCSKGSK